MPHVITGDCCSLGSCVRVCPLDCIHPRPDEPGFATAEMLFIDPGVCIDCGACADACAADAAKHISTLTGDQQHYAQANREHFRANPVPAGSQAPSWTLRPLPPGTPRLRIAIIGSGPAGMFAAEELLRHPEVEVDVYERLYTPWGLLRSGVAPDHPRTKSVAATFEVLAREANVRLLLGVEVGKDVSVDELRRHYHAVVIAIGASAPKKLAVPGHALPGSLAAAELAAWYNGHPDSADLDVRLAGPRAVVVGNGNLALDIARMLLADPGALRATDIAAHALAALETGAITEVTIVGRGDPAQAAFTEPAADALARCDSLSITTDREFTASDLRAHRALRTLQGAGPRTASKRVNFRFATSVAAIRGGDSVEYVRLVGTNGHSEVIPACLVVHAIGHHRTPLPGLAMDAAGPTAAGRVTAQGVPIPGLYSVGWHKRGARGTIGANRFCAKATIAALRADYIAGKLRQPVREPADLEARFRRASVHPVGYAGWLKIDSEERRRGHRALRPRIKLVDHEELSARAHD
ncbi:FAD-dependent oxidoreductase [Nocardia goodfellowii]|uniref:ferredoxin--NADP(+) reductase n=1 Tax=Nocardia goodfellowii TaxID=882446 RepID=A0ABS4QLM1_9NOCA|nr:FAD-dependent oxidoreductase [Nocardia goodfellowii]MBP2191576.1 ferredoxin--NADP+ reductase [Nocardia goodfellowii]